MVALFLTCPRDRVAQIRRPHQRSGVVRHGRVFHGRSRPNCVLGGASNLLGPKSPYFAQATALILMERYLNVSIACGAIALLHFGAEWLYFGRSPRRLWILLVLGLLSLSLVEATWVAPRLNRLHVTAHAPNVTEFQHQAAAASFAAWRGVVKAADLVVLCALAFYLWRVANPGEPTRFSSAGKFRG